FLFARLVFAGPLFVLLVFVFILVCFLRILALFAIRFFALLRVGLTAFAIRHEHVADLGHVAFGDAHLLDGAVKGGRDVGIGLVGFHGQNHVAVRDRIAAADMDIKNLGFFQSFAGVGECEFLGHGWLALIR